MGDDLRQLDGGRCVRRHGALTPYASRVASISISIVRGRSQNAIVKQSPWWHTTTATRRASSEIRVPQVCGTKSYSPIP